MIKKQLKIGDYLQSYLGSEAFVDKILPTKVRVWINGKKDYILDNQLHHWSYGNPIKGNRIVNSKTFAIRLKDFIEHTNVSDPMSEEEKEYLIRVADMLLKYQIQTATDKEEINYLKRLNLYG